MMSRNPLPSSDPNSHSDRGSWDHDDKKSKPDGFQKPQLPTRINSNNPSVSSAAKGVSDLKNIGSLKPNNVFISSKSAVAGPSDFSSHAQSFPASKSAIGTSNITPKHPFPGIVLSKSVQRVQNQGSLTTKTHTPSTASSTRSNYSMPDDFNDEICEFMDKLDKEIGLKNSKGQESEVRDLRDEKYNIMKINGPKFQKGASGKEGESSSLVPDTFIYMTDSTTNVEDSFVFDDDEFDDDQMNALDEIEQLGEVKYEGAVEQKDSKVLDDPMNIDGEEIGQNNVEIRVSKEILSKHLQTKDTSGEGRLSIANSANSSSKLQKRQQKPISQSSLTKFFPQRKNFEPPTSSLKVTTSTDNPFDINSSKACTSVPTDLSLKIDGPLHNLGSQQTVTIKKSETTKSASSTDSKSTSSFASAYNTASTVNSNPTIGTSNQQHKEEKSSAENASRLSLKHPQWQLPLELVDAYSEKGIAEMYEWQADCLASDDVYKGNRNLVYSAPTSAGKTFVAEIISVRKVLTTKTKALIILPFVSVVSEKEKYLKSLLKKLKIKVEGYFAGEGGRGGSVDCDIAVCTIEKANGLVNRLIEEDKLGCLGTVVVDELHMIGDENRGYLLELLLTKLRVVLKGEVQIIGMSATLPNLPMLATWLDAHLYVTQYRPIPLKEHIIVRDRIYNNQFKIERMLKSERHPKDPDFLVPLCWEVVKENKSVLIFCSSKDGTEKCAWNIASLMVPTRDEETLSKRLEVRESLRRCPAGLDPILEDTIPQGIAYHHAGLTIDERDIIESAFRNGTLLILAATCTLAAGVNLPARRVIFRTPYLGGQFLDAGNYQQMKGRAGRKGQDVVGESYLICKEGEYNRAKNLITAELEPVKSCLTSERRGMKRALLEVIASGVVNSPEDVKKYVECTLLCAEQTYEDVKETADVSIKYLTENEFISIRGRENNNGQIYSSTKLGLATVASSLSPEEGLIVFSELKQALRNFVLEDELHVVYHVTPIYINLSNIDYNTYYNLYDKLSAVQKHIADVIGIEEGWLVRASMGMVSSKGGKDETSKRIAATHRRFYASMMLNDLVHEVPFSDVVRKYKVNKGVLQSLQITSSTFAGMVAVFCQRLGWVNLELILNQFQDRLNFGVEKELCELAKVPYVKGFRARSLYAAGLKSVASLATATVDEIFQILIKAQPFKSAKGDEEKLVQYQRRIELRAAAMIVKSAQEILAEETEELNRNVATLKDTLRKASITGSKKSSTRSLQLSQSNQTIQKKISISNADDVINPEESRQTIPPNQLLLSSESSRIGQLYRLHNVADTQELFTKFIEILKQQSMVVFNIVATRRNGELSISGLAITWNPAEVCYVDLTNLNCDRKEILNLFKSDSFKVSFDMKLKLKILLSNGFSVKGNLMDPKIAQWLLSPEDKQLNLQQMFESIFPNHGLSGLGNSKEENCCREAVQTFLVMQHLAARLENEKLYEHFIKVEMKMAYVLAQMELCGIGFDPNVFENYCAIFERKLAEVEQRAYALAGRPFNIKSPAEVGTVLFDELRLPYEEQPSKSVKPGSKRPLYRSTSKEVLVKLSAYHELPVIIADYRRLQILMSKHILPFQNFKVPVKVFNMYRVRTTFETYSATGRIHTTDPNLQNIPHPINPSSLLEADDIPPTPCHISLRDAFQAGEGNVLLSADYAQLELRILAHLSQDPYLVEALKSGGDLFKSVAAFWNKITVNEVTYQQRQQAKGVCYGIIYGMGASSLASNLDVSVEEAEKFIESFNTTYKSVPKFVDEVISKCRQCGYVETLLGRRRFLPNINSKLTSERHQAERQALNTTIQGSAADLVKTAMIQLMETCRVEYEDAIQQDKLDAFSSSKPGPEKPILVLQVHDELLFEVPSHMLDTVKTLVQKCMENAIKLSVPLPVRVKVGKSWGHLV